MVKLIIAFAVAFIAALAGGAGLKLSSAKAHAVVVGDSLKKVAAADAAKKPHAAAGDSAAHAGAPVAHGADTARDTAGAHATPATTGPAPAEPTRVEPAKGTVTGTRGAAAPTATAGPAVPPARLPTGVIGERMGKIFAAMPSKDAAKVLGELDDKDVAFIIAKLPNKKAAEVLALMPKERAAAISRTVIAQTTTPEKTP